MQFDTTGLETYLTDPSVEREDGVWLRFPGDRKIHVLRAGGSNRKFLQAFSALTKPHKRQMQRGTLDPDLSDKILIEVYLEAVILGWEGFCEANGTPIKYSKTAARELFTQVPELFQDVVNFASDAATFQQRDAEEAAEHLGESSDGPSSTETRKSSKR